MGKNLCSNWYAIEHLQTIQTMRHTFHILEYFSFIHIEVKKILNTCHFYN